jgi:pimeloyl-ACP methyl ester carboxylesterase
MPSTVQVAGAELAWFESGTGPAILLVHGLADRARGGDAVARPLSEVARVVSYDRRAYGDSSAPEVYERTTVAEQSEDAAALLTALDVAPAVVCGRDFGALVALDLVRRHRGLVSGVVVVDPPLYAFSARAAEVLGAERVALENALRTGGPAAAVRDWLEARGGAGPERLAAAGEDHRAFFADYAGLATWPVLRRDLRAFDVPMTVLLSAGAPAHVREAAEALASLVPGATLGPEADLVPAIQAHLATPGRH